MIGGDMRLGSGNDVLLRSLERFFVKVWMSPRAHCWVEGHPEIVLSHELYDEFLSLSRQVSYSLYPSEDDGEPD